MALDKETFNNLMDESDATRDAIDAVADRRELELVTLEKKNGRH